MKTDIELIRLFGCTIFDEETSNKYNFKDINIKANQLGYIVMPDACNESVDAFLDTCKINPNSTFYATWNDVTSKNRLELFIDQIFHYASTYGTDFSVGNGYVPNETMGNDIDTEAFKDYKVITAVTIDEMADKCLDLLKSGIALKQATMQPVANMLIDYHLCGNNPVEFPIDEIKNKEAMIYICDKLNITPNDKFSLFRYIIFKTTGSTMIIQNDVMICQIRFSENPFDFNRLSHSQMIALSSIFYRFKKLFVAFKHNEVIDNRKAINVLNRLAPTYHEPLVVGLWENLLSVEFSENEIRNSFDKANNFKLITILQAITERIATITCKTDRMYYIRNGKSFFKENKDTNNTETISKLFYYNKIYALIKDELVRRMQMKQCIVKYPKGVNLACPTSEKNFVGDIPFGTSFEMGDKSFVGIYWRNEWGTRDFDLSMNDENLNRIGWNAGYKTDNNGVVYSGDMTNADPEATEIIQFNVGAPNGVVMSTQYSGDSKSKFRMFFGIDDKMDLHCNYMVDPSKIMLSSDVDIVKRETMIGIVNDKKFYVMSLATGNRIVSNIDDMTIRMFKSMVSKAISFVNVKDILDDAGFVDYDTLNPDDIAADATILDLTDIKRDTLITLFS